MHAEPFPVIAVANLNYWHGDGERARHTLIDNNLRINPGEVVIMDGPSGSGKTTMLTLIGGLRKIQQGSVRVLNQELFDRSDADLVAVRRGIGFIFQAHNLFKSLTAYENIKMAMELQSGSSKQIRKRAEELLEKFLMVEHIDKKPAKLSGGQRQRVAIARALANRPKLILADEPTAALDARSGEAVMNEFLEIAKNGSTVLIVTHDDRVKKHGDRVVTMEDGRIKYDFYPKEAALIAKFLADCRPFFSYRANPLALLEVAAKMTREFHPQGTVLFQQGDVGDKFYLIREGRAKVEIAQPDGDSVKEVKLGASDFFGEIALIEKKPRSGTVTATEDLIVYTLNAEDFAKARRDIGSFEEQIMKALRQRQ